MAPHGTPGRGIVSVAKTGTAGLVDTYTITYTDGSTSTFTITNGANGEITATSLASEFTASVAYSAGEYVVYSGQLYIFTADHAAGAWTGADVQPVQLADVIANMTVDGIGPSSFSGANVPDPPIEYDGYYLDYNTGNMVANANYAVTKLYPVTPGEFIIMGGYSYGSSYDEKRAYAFYAADGETVVLCSYALSNLDGAGNAGTNSYTQTWGNVPNDNTIAFIRWTVHADNKSRVFLNDPEKEATTFTDSSLNEAIGKMASGNLLDASVSLKNLDFVDITYYNKIRYDKKVWDYSPFKNPSNMLPDETLVGVFETDIVAGETYWTKENIAAENAPLYLMCYDTDGNYVGSSFQSIYASALFESYEDIVINYMHYYRFVLKPVVAKVLCAYVPTGSAYGYNKKLICLYSEWNPDKPIDAYEIATTSEAFATLVKDISTSFDSSALEGKVWVALGDSYTAGMGGNLQNIANEYGMILDNRGVVSSSIAGDTTGSKGFKPMWNRASHIVEDYTDGYVIDGETYHVSDVALITFMGGANDGFGLETWIGVQYGLADTDTGRIYGACNHIFNVLLEGFAAAKMICITQPSSYSRTIDTSISDATAQALGFEDAAAYLKMTNVQLSNYAMAIKEEAVRRTAVAYGVPVLDAFAEFPTVLNSANRAAYWQNDKLHLTGDGNRLLARMIQDKIKDVFSE